MSGIGNNLLAERIKANLGYFERNLAMIIDEDVVVTLKGNLDYFVERYNALVMGERNEKTIEEAQRLDSELNYCLKESSQIVIDTRDNYKMLLQETIKRLETARLETNNFIDRIAITGLITSLNSRWRLLVTDHDVFPTKKDFDELEGIFPDSKASIKEQMKKANEHLIALGGVGAGRSIADVFNDMTEKDKTVEGKSKQLALPEPKLGDVQLALSQISQLFDKFKEAGKKAEAIGEHYTGVIPGFKKARHIQIPGDPAVYTFGIIEFQNSPMFTVSLNYYKAFAMVTTDGEIVSNQMDNIRAFEPMLDVILRDY